MTIDVLDHGDLVEFVGHGELSAECIMSTSAAFHTNTPRRLALWNFLDARISYFKAAHFPAVASKGADLAKLRGTDARNAILVRNEDERLLLQAYAFTASAVSPVHHEIFVDRDDALAWLKS